MEMTALINKMFIFVVLMVIGYGAARLKAVGPEFAKDASKLVINVFMIASIIKPVLNSQFQLSLKELASVMFLVCLAMALCWVIALAAALPMKKLGDNKSTFELLAGATNIIFIGLPVVETLYGSKAVFYCALTCMPFNALFYTVGVWRMQEGKGKVRLKDIFSTPLIATIVGLIIFLSSPTIPPVLEELCATLAGATLPLSMVVIGASLGSVNLAAAFKRKELYYMCFVRLLLAPLLIWLVLGFFTADEMLRVTTTLLCACPTAVMVTVLAIQYGKDPVFSSQGVLLSTVLSLFTLPLLVAILV